MLGMGPQAMYPTYLGQTVRPPELGQIWVDPFNIVLLFVMVKSGTDTFVLTTLVLTTFVLKSICPKRHLS